MNFFPSLVLFTPQQGWWAPPSAVYWAEILSLGMTELICWVDLDRPPTAEDVAANSVFVKCMEQVTPQNLQLPTECERETVSSYVYIYIRVFQTQNQEFSCHLTASRSQVYTDGAASC